MIIAIMVILLSVGYFGLMFSPVTGVQEAIPIWMLITGIGIANYLLFSWFLA